MAGSNFMRDEVEVWMERNRPAKIAPNRRAP
jgi:hypothetical protein